MRELRGKLLRAVSDATIGTAIVMVHVLLADRDRLRRAARDVVDLDLMISVATRSRRPDQRRVVTFLLN